jgi:hypothetical protein
MGHQVSVVMLRVVMLSVIMLVVIMLSFANPLVILKKDCMMTVNILTV